MRLRSFVPGTIGTWTDAQLEEQKQALCYFIAISEGQEQRDYRKECKEITTEIAKRKERR